MDDEALFEVVVVEEDEGGYHQVGDGCISKSEEDDLPDNSTLNTKEVVEVSLEVEPLQAVEDGGMVISEAEGDGEELVGPHELIVDEINYSTPDGKAHRVMQFSGAIAPPSVGMTFDSWEMVESYFRSYGKQNGFGIVRGASAYRQKNGKSTTERRSVRWECEYFGTKDNRVRVNGKKVTLSRMPSVAKDGLKLGTRGTKKCQCPVHIYASAQRDENVWVIRKAILEHEGHSPTPSKSRHVSMYRQDAITGRVKKKLLIDLEAGVKLPQIHRAMALERNGLENMPFTERDLRNVVAKEKRMKMEVEGGDAQAMVNYLKKMAADNEKFFHVERVDTLDRLKDVMWVDARSRAAYEDFGDVVCFDTTYITNKFKLPFANFVGVNHHGQTILLGCALLSHENAETFEWLFEIWLSCMGGKAPAGILTDQCAAMRKALAKVMPQSRLRWCLWHILQKFSSKLDAYKDYEIFKVELHNAIYDSLTMEEFQVNWCTTVGKYNLVNQEWLPGLYKEQHMWVPAHMKHIFWVGMKTTQRSESINSFFDGYVKKQTLLYEFISQYFAALEARAYAEENADADSSRNLQQLVTQFPFEVEFQKLYTKAKFIEFQKGSVKLMYVNQTSSWKVNEHVMGHRIDDQLWHRCKTSRKEIPTDKYCHYTVMFDTRSNNAWCGCKLFESNGIVCRHIVRVFAGHRVKKLPQMFVLDRWRKDIVRTHTKVKVRHHDLSKTEEVKRYDEIMYEFEPLCLLGARNEEYKDEVIKAIRKTLEELQNKIEGASRSKGADNMKEIVSPSSVNKKRMSEASSPSSVKNQQQTCAEGGAGNGTANATDAAAACATDDSTTIRTGSSTPLPDFVKDPPLPKAPKHRTTSSRFKSAAEVARSNSGKGGGRGRGSASTNNSVTFVPGHGLNPPAGYCDHQQQYVRPQMEFTSSPNQLQYAPRPAPIRALWPACPNPIRTYGPRPMQVGTSYAAPPLVEGISEGNMSCGPARSVGSIVLSSVPNGNGTVAGDTLAYGIRNIPPNIPPKTDVPDWMRGVVSNVDQAGTSLNFL